MIRQVEIPLELLDYSLIVRDGADGATCLGIYEKYTNTEYYTVLTHDDLARLVKELIKFLPKKVDEEEI